MGLPVEFVDEFGAPGCILILSGVICVLPNPIGAPDLKRCANLGSQSTRNGSGLQWQKVQVALDFENYAAQKP